MAAGNSSTLSGTTAASRVVFYIGVLGVVAAVIFTFVKASTLTGSVDTQEELNNAISTIMVANGILVFFFLVVSMMYINSDPSVERLYIIFMINVTLFLALVSVGVSVLSKRA